MWRSAVKHDLLLRDYDVVLSRRIYAVIEMLRWLNVDDADVRRCNGTVFWFACLNESTHAAEFTLDRCFAAALLYHLVQCELLNCLLRSVVCGMRATIVNMRSVDISSVRLRGRRWSFSVS